MGRWELKFLVVCAIGLRIRALNDVWGANLQLGEVAVYAAGAVGRYEQGLVALQVEVVAIGFGQHLHEATRSEQDAEVSGVWDGRVEFDFHDKRIGGSWDMKERQGCVAKKCL